MRHPELAKENHLFFVPAMVRAGLGRELPPDCQGALVSCYVAAPDHLEAVQLSVDKLNAEGYVFEDLMNDQVHEIDALRWDEHVAMVWTDHDHRFPSQAEMLRFLKAGGVFFGPVCGWDAEP